MTKEEFGMYCKEKRNEADLPQSIVAEAMGYTTAQYISNIERGSTPSIKVLKEMCKMYGCSEKEMKEKWVKLQANRWDLCE